MPFQSISVDRDGSIAHVTLNRPEVHNAFNPQVIRELTEAFVGIGREPWVRAVVLRGNGRSFCAGADLNWMQESLGYTDEENIADAERMSVMMEAIDTCPVPVIGRVQGAALGGGVGLVSVCDIVVAEMKTKFGFTEVRLGIIPAVISPYAVRKIGYGHARSLFLTGQRFDAYMAYDVGLVHMVVTGEDNLDEAVAEQIKHVLASGPQAVTAAKQLVRDVVGMKGIEARTFTARQLAIRRTSAEGQAGIRAFLEKQPPPWIEPERDRLLGN